MSRFAALRVALIADVLDSLGERTRVLEPGIAAISADTSATGRAATLKVIAADRIPETPYAVQFDAIEHLRPGELLIVEMPESSSAAFWGELLTTSATVRRCAGAVLDGYTRDVAQVKAMGFPLWCRGAHPADSAGRLEAIESGRPITCGDVLVSPGDIVAADSDGVVVVPAGMAADVARAAEAKAGIEDRVREALASGDRLHDVYVRYGVM